MDSVKTIAVDFDGCIHRYREGFKDGSIYDYPMPGVEEALKKLMEKYAVFIFSSRDPYQIMEWMDKKFTVKTQVINDAVKFWEQKDIIGITTKKLPAIVYIDDRALKFISWGQVLREIK